MDTIADIPGIRSLWQETTGDARVRIAVLDGPVDPAHDSLRGANLSGVGGAALPRPGNGPAAQHGTYVASILFGQPGSRVKGVAPGCCGLVIPIFRDDEAASPVCTQAQLAAAIRAAVGAGAHVINISAGQTTGSGVGADLAAAIRQCDEAGVLVVAAAGNENDCTELLIPGALPSVLAVASSGGAIGFRPGLTGAARHRQPNCLFAPGDHIRGALPENTFDVRSGSSYAAAVVSGVAALLLSLQRKQRGAADPRQVRDALLRSAEKAEYHPVFSPAGFLNVPGAVAQLKEGPPPGAAAVAPGPGPAAADPVPGIAALLAARERPGRQAPPRWQVTPRALAERYAGVDPAKFGTVDVQTPGAYHYTVPDLHYPVGDGMGMYLLPASDEAPIVLSTGQIVGGSDLVDAWLRRQMDLGPHDPLYALLSYIRPEEHAVPFFRLPEQKLRMSHQHVAAYAGRGRTLHALHANTDWRGPHLLHMHWNLDRYPANVHTVALEGVPPAVLNRNALIVETILTAGVKAPVHPETLRCRTVDLNTVLQFYRDTIRQADYLEDFSWYTNCTVQKTIALNVLLNVPHNPAAFGEIFGADGPLLWEDFRHRYRVIAGEDFGPGHETHFTPLWKQEGLAPERIAPLTYRQYNAFFAARTEGRLADYPGPVPLPPGVGMAWPLETLFDVLGAFFETYLAAEAWDETGAAAMLLFLRHDVPRRTGLAAGTYLKMMAPVVAEALHARVRHDPAGAAGLGGAAEDLLRAVQQFDEAAGQPTEPLVGLLLDQCAGQAQQLLAEDRREGATPPDGTRLPACRTLVRALSRLRDAVLEAGQAEFFTTPSVLHRIANGAYRHSPFVTIRTVCTVLEAGQLTACDETVLPQITQETYTTTMEKTFSPMSNVPKREEEPVSPQACSDPNKKCGSRDGQSALVYAFGRIGYRFVSASRRDSIKHQMGENRDPGEPAHLLEYLKAHPYEAASIQWTLTLEGTPIYVIVPQGPYARDAYDLLTRFLHEQTHEGVERVSLPGYVIGYVDLGSGGEVPAVVPEIRGMYSWTTRALVDAVVGEPPAGATETLTHEERMWGVGNFLERVYYEMRNLGRQPNERALNFAATNAFQAERIYENALREEMELESIQVEPNPLAREGSENWDVKLSFFFPKRERSPLKVFRFTVDVSDVVPVVIGPVRSWFTPVR